MLNGVLYLLIFLRFGLSLSFVFYSLLTSLLIVISYIDLDSKYIYSSTTILGVVLAAIYIVVGLYTKDISISNNVLGGAIGYGIIYLIVVITKGMGQGDAEVAGVCGLFIGIKGILVCLFIAVVLGGLVAAIILIFKLKEKKSEIAFSPYISIGSIVYILLGKEILSLYLNFFI